MKIGIMSMQRVQNYGSFLQAFALKHLIEDSTGEIVEFVDFQTKSGVKDPAKESYGLFKSQGIKYMTCVLLNYLSKFVPKSILFRSRRFSNIVNIFRFYDVYCHRFRSEFWPLLGLNIEETYHPYLDLLVIGSDEVFNYAEAQNAGYSDDLFGANQNARRVISFAGSFGCTKIEDLNRLGCTEKIKGYLSKFSNISVRDVNSKTIVESLIGKHCQYHLDPVFHYDYTPYMPKKKKGKSYMAVYAYSGLSDDFKKEIKAYAKKNNLKILSFMGYQTDLGEYVDASPFELLTYMKNATCIVTTTFHGAVFSIKYNKPFCAIAQHRIDNGYGNDEKLGDLLIRTGLAKQMIDSPQMISKTLERTIDYRSVNDYINHSVLQGKNYLLSEIRIAQSEDL